MRSQCEHAVKKKKSNVLHRELLHSSPSKASRHDIAVRSKPSGTSTGPGRQSHRLRAITLTAPPAGASTRGHAPFDCPSIIWRRFCAQTFNLVIPTLSRRGPLFSEEEEGHGWRCYQFIMELLFRVMKKTWLLPPERTEAKNTWKNGASTLHQDRPGNLASRQIYHDDSVRLRVSPCRSAPTGTSDAEPACA